MRRETPILLLLHFFYFTIISPKWTVAAATENSLCTGGTEDSFCTGEIDRFDTCLCKECLADCGLDRNCAAFVCGGECQGTVDPTCPEGWKFTKADTVAGCCPDECLGGMDDGYNCLGCPASLFEENSSCAPLTEASCPPVDEELCPPGIDSEDNMFISITVLLTSFLNALADFFGLG